jgi:hypothetical protein
MNAATMRRRYGREPVSAYIGEGWSLLHEKSAAWPSIA